MQINYMEEQKMFHLKTKNASYLFRVREGYALQHLYYGKRIDDLTGIEYMSDEHYMGATLHAIDAEFVDSGLSTDRLPLEYPVYGSADLRSPAFHATYKDGSRITKFYYESHHIYPGKPKLEGLPAVYANETEAQTLELVMKDPEKELKIILRYSVFSELDVITRSITVQNEGNEQIKIEKILSCSVDFEDCDYDLIHLHGEAMRECEIERTPLIHGEMKISSARGASSHLHSPFFALVKKDASENYGEVFAFSLLYSGNFEAGAEVDSLENTRAFLGINSFDFHWLLDMGETLTTPEAVMVYSSEGIGKMSRTFHELYREHLARGNFKNKMRPVLINSWEAAYMDFDEEKIVRLAKKAKEAGIELLVLDDGWFGKRNDDSSSLGDWKTNLKKIPNGIAALSENVEKIGLKFGLWFEPEMVSPDSDLYRKHPDWCIHVKGRRNSLGRHQLVLDLSRKEVCEYIIEAVSSVLRSGKISYIKWDMNRNFTEIGSAELPPQRQAETAHRYMLGLYEILEKIKTEFPDILLEGCASGGGRFDPGMMYYFDQFWTSDNSDAADRIKIQYGTSYVMPSIFMGAHVSAVPNHQTGRVVSMKTRGLVAMCGQFGYELDVTKLDEQEFEAVRDQINQYKEIRQIIQLGDMYRLQSPYEGGRTVLEFISKDRKTVCCFCFNGLCAVQRNTERILLKDLEKGGCYSCAGKNYSAEFLEKIGFEPQIMTDHEGELFVFHSSIERL